MIFTSWKLARERARDKLLKNPLTKQPYPWWGFTAPTSTFARLGQDTYNYMTLLEDSIKLGEGGIRELEFIVQSFQLVRGGQDARLQGTRFRPTLKRLAEIGLMDGPTVSRLDQCYRFLRAPPRDSSVTSRFWTSTARSQRTVAYAGMAVPQGGSPKPGSRIRPAHALQAPHRAP